MLGGEIKVVMTLDDKDFSIKTVKAGKTLQELSENVAATARSTKVLEDRFTGIGQKFRDWTLAISVARFALRDFSDIVLALPRAVINASAEVERLTALMSGLSKETTKAARDAEALRGTNFVFNMAKNAPFEVKALGDAFVKLKVAGIDPTNGSMQALVDSVAKFGGGSQQLQRASIAIQQMAGKGVVSMEELRQQLGEAIPDAMQAMAIGVGLSMSQLAAQVAKGTVAAQGNIQRMLTVMRLTNEGSAAAMVQTWTGTLERMKTTWTLFLNDVGKDGFFDKAKQGLNGLLEGFQGQQSRDFAATLGRSLSQLVTILAESINFIVKFKDEIVFAGQAMLVYFAANKLKSIAEGIKSALVSQEITQARQAWTDRLTASRRAQAQELADKIKFNEDMIAANARGRDADIAQAQRAVVQKNRAQREELLEQARASERKNALLKQEMLELKTTTDAKQAALAKARAAAAADLAFYEQQVRRRSNLATVAGVSDPSIQRDLQARRAETAALVADLDRRIAVERQSMSVLALSAQAEAKKAAALRETAAAIPTLRRELQGQLPVMTQHTALINATNANLQAATDKYKAKAEALTKVTMATRLAGGAIAGLQSIFSALGGWVTVAVVAVTFLAEKLYEVLTRWQKAKEISDQIAKGISPTDQNQKAIEDRRKELETKVKELTDRIALGTDPTAPAQLRLGTSQLASARAELDKYQAQLVAMDKAVQEGRLLRAGDLANDTVAAVNRIMERQTQTFRASMNAQISVLQKEKERQLASASSGEKESIEKSFGDQIRQRFKDTAQKEVAMWSDLEKRQLANYQAAKREGNREAVIVSERAYLNATEGLQRAKDLFAQAEALGKVDTLAADKNKAKIERENPLARLLVESRADLQKSQIELEALKKDALTLADQKNLAAADLIGRMARGELDFKTADGKSVEYLGGQAERKKAQDAFLQYLKQGRTDIDAFVDSLGKLKTEQREWMKEIIANVGLAKQNAVQEKALSDARQVAAGAQSELNAAVQDYNESLSRTTAFDRLVKHFDQLATKVGQAGTQLAEFTKLKAQALADQASADIYRFAAQGRQAEEASQNETATDPLTKLRLERDNKLRLIEETYQANLRNLRATATDYERFIRDMDTLDKGRQANVNAINNAFNAKAKTDMDRLREQWADVTTAMNQASAGWASSFMDNIANALTGTTVQWRQWLANLLKDFLAIGLKKTIGQEVSSAFDFLGAIGKSSLGAQVGAKEGETSKTAQIETILSKVAENIKVDWSSMISQVGTGLSNMWEGAVSWVTKLFEQVMTWVTNLIATTQASDSTSETAGSVVDAFFANGGVMSKYGSMPLNTYANGGVANRPQVALFGEGRLPEAYVPLPDGRSIPVTMRGGAGGGNVVNISIVVNSDGSTDTEASDQSNWAEMAQKVKVLVENEIVRQKRPGGQLQGVA